MTVLGGGGQTVWAEMLRQAALRHGIVMSKPARSLSF